MLETDFRFGEVYRLADRINYGADRVQFKNIFTNGNGGVALVAFKSGQQLDTHTAPAELMVTVIEGEIVFTVAGKPNTLRAGDFMLVGEGVAHSVVANADSKMMLAKIKA